MSALASSILINKRFSRSANVERDKGPRSIEGYLPTGRAIDVVTRLGRGLQDSSAGRAFSITGPHGGGKSSLAVFLDALLSPRESAEHNAAVQILSSVEPGAAEVVLRGLASLDPAGQGFVRAFATAEREPVAVTIARALHSGARREFGDRQRLVPNSLVAAPAGKSVEPKQILESLRVLALQRPVVIVIDEFGKNLEAYAESGREGDPYLLQELAEACQGENAMPVALLTLQHLSFDEYVQEASVARRREWAKVQGRFQDIPYVETARQARRLICSTLQVKDPVLARAVARWVSANEGELAEAGLRDLLGDTPDSYPLHPTVLAVLPELCSRYGQNERTLFSFLAGSEPLAVPRFLEDESWSSKRPLPFVGLDRVYDYFLDSAGTSVGASATASRWLEIEHRLRDTMGLSPDELKALKAIGVLNLVSSSGTLRASERLLLASLAPVMPHLDTKELKALLAQLEAKGLITYREFSDEYRIWQGSDYDLRAAVEVARHGLRDRSLASLLNEALDAEPVIAGRHSQERGILRAFERTFSDLDEQLEAPDDSSLWDGRLVLATRTDLGVQVKVPPQSRPVVVAVPNDLGTVRDRAMDAVALQRALESAEGERADWVARRELIERLSVARQALRIEAGHIWNPLRVKWVLLNNLKDLDSAGGGSAVLSRACDLAFKDTPRLANEMLAKRELTSQGAKARRVLIEAMISRPHEEAFDIEGYGPERAMYEALFRSTGLHRQIDDRWTLSHPVDSKWCKVWEEVQRSLDSATGERLSLLAVGDRLRRPPLGLKEGVIPVLLIAAILDRDEDVALYEHGSMVLRLDDAVAERLAKNPGHFAVKNMATSSPPRKAAVEALARTLITSTPGAEPSFLQVARALFRELRSLPPYAQATKRNLGPATIELRDAFRNAVEPDELFFRTLPKIFGIPEFGHAGPANPGRAEEFAGRVADAILELRQVFPDLTTWVAHQLAAATASPTRDAAELQARLAGQAVNLQDRIIDPRLRAFVGALSRAQLETTDWLNNVAMVTVEGHAPRTWTDELASRFSIQVQELGGALRRTQALLYEQVASERTGFESRRVTVTRPDGVEEVDVLTLTEAERDVVEPVARELVTRLTATFGSSETVRRTLMAWLVLGEHAAEAPMEHDSGAVQGELA
jgi:hypothetical protein